MLHTGQVNAIKWSNSMRLDGQANAITQLVADGAARVVVAVGQLGGWSLLVCYGLAAQRSKQLRVFRKLDTLVLYLQQIGVSRFEVDASSFMLALRQR